MRMYKCIVHQLGARKRKFRGITAEQTALYISEKQSLTKKKNFLKIRHEIVSFYTCWYPVIDSHKI